jgi:hypothetical protein
MIPTIFPRIEFRNPVLAAKIKGQGYFIQEADIHGLIAIDRHMLVLVRTNMGRFLCPVDCVNHYVELINRADYEKDGGDYVRDVSLPV